MGIFAKIKKAWFDTIVWETIDDEFYDELEDSLIMADLGATVAHDAVKKLRDVVYQKSIQRGDDVKQALRDILIEKLNVGDTALDLSTKPSVVLVIGVNGVGKTTSIGKIAHRLKGEGKRVLLCAADTFRAAAADQLEIWANRAECEIVRSVEGADPGAVLFDSLAAAKARGVDVVLCDTAGRLHAVAKVNHPVEQGFVAMAGVFIDTFIVLNLTAFVILTTKSIPTGLTGAELSQYAFSTLYGKGGNVFIAICMFFFAFSTIIGWYFFGQANVKYLFGPKAVKIYSVLAACCVFLGSLAEVDLVWNMADCFNSLMVIPNILALFALSKVISQVHKDYFTNFNKAK